MKKAIIFVILSTCILACKNQEIENPSISKEPLAIELHSSNPTSIWKTEKAPLIILDIASKKYFLKEEVSEKFLQSIDADTIENMNVLKQGAEVDRYSLVKPSAKNGIIIIKLKENNIPLDQLELIH